MKDAGGNFAAGFFLAAGAAAFAGAVFLAGRLLAKAQPKIAQQGTGCGCGG